MELVQEVKGNYFGTLFSYNDRYIVAIMSSYVNILDVETLQILQRLNIKNARFLQFSPNDNYLIIKTTTSVLHIYDMKKAEIIYHKRIGENDGYNIVFVNDDEFITGENSTQSIIFNIKDLSYKILPFNNIDLDYLALSGDNKLIGFSTLDNKSYIFEIPDMYSCEVKILYKIDKVCMPSQYSNYCIYYVSGEGYNKHAFNKYNILDHTVKSVKLNFSPFYISTQKNNHYVGCYTIFKGCIFDSNLKIVKKIEKTIFNTGVNISFANCSDMVLINVDRKLMLYSLQ